MSSRKNACSAGPSLPSQAPLIPHPPPYPHPEHLHALSHRKFQSSIHAIISLEREFFKSKGLPTPPPRNTVHVSYSVTWFYTTTKIILNAFNLVSWWKCVNYTWSCLNNSSPLCAKTKVSSQHDWVPADSYCNIVLPKGTVADIEADRLYWIGYQLWRAVCNVCSVAHNALLSFGVQYF